jgi:hypothetical protein
MKVQRCASCHTLQHQHSPSGTSCKRHKTAQEDLEPTALFLSSSPTGAADEERLYLPRSGTAPCSLDVYLQSIPSVANRTSELLDAHSSSDQAANWMTTARSKRCLNVLQGEVAHATPHQTDVLVSAEATTCHILALRSTHGENSVPLGSMAHVDRAQVYEECLEKMVQEHIQHHVRTLKKQRQRQDSDDFGFFTMDDDDQEEEDLDLDGELSATFLPQTNLQSSNKKKHPCRASSLPSLEAPIAMEVHIVGGYLDEKGTSQQLSNNLVRTFSELALKYQDKVRMSLSTAAISSMNNNTSDGTPRTRGLALDTHTGLVTPVVTALPKELEGPALEVRSARLWSNQLKPTLAVIHNSQSEDGCITIEPFHYKPLPQFNALLKVDDATLLKAASTSPDCESERFCSDLRRTLSFVNTVPAASVFGRDKTARPLVYSRSSNALNQWQRVKRSKLSALPALASTKIK